MSEANHWYDTQGRSCHTQPTKSKGAKNPTRPTTIADAKKLKLLPSVSSILRQAYNPILERYKAIQIVKACYGCPPIGDEDFDTYCAHILEKADKERDDAADLGTRIHDAIERFLVDPMADIDDDLIAYVDAAVNKVKAMGITIAGREVSVVSPLGYAGKTDLAFTQNEFCGILDFKSTKTKPDEPVVSRQSQPAQIAAYHVAFWCNGQAIRDNSKGYNVYISTTEPGRIDVVEYDAATLRREFDYFMHCFAIWKHRYNYDPRTAFSQGPEVLVEEEITDFI